MLFVKHEGNLKVYLVALYVALFDHDVLILDPSALYVPQGLGGPSYALLDGVLETLIRDSADFCYIAIRIGCSEAKRRLKASGVVRSLPSSITSPFSES